MARQKRNWKQEAKKAGKAELRRRFDELMVQIMGSSKILTATMLRENFDKLRDVFTVNRLIHFLRSRYRKICMSAIDLLQKKQHIDDDRFFPANLVDNAGIKPMPA